MIAKVPFRAEDEGADAVGGDCWGHLSDMVKGREWGWGGTGDEQGALLKGGLIGFCGGENVGEGEGRVRPGERVEVGVVECEKGVVEVSGLRSICWPGFGGTFLDR